MKAFTNPEYNGKAFRVKIEDLKKAQELFDPVATKAQVSLALHEAAKLAQDAVKQVTPVKSGKTRKGWKRKVNGPDSVTVFNEEPGASLLYFGAKPHIIQPSYTGAMALSNINNERAGYYGSFGPVRWARHPGFASNEKYARVIERDVGELAFEVAGGMLSQFYMNHGRIQRRISGKFGKGF